MIKDLLGILVIVNVNMIKRVVKVDIWTMKTVKAEKNSCTIN